MKDESFYNAYDLNILNEPEGIKANDPNFKNPNINLIRVYGGGSKNMNVLYLFDMGVNWPTFNICNLDEKGVSHISLFNNDFGLKIFKYDS